MSVISLMRNTLLCLFDTMFFKMVNYFKVFFTRSFVLKQKNQKFKSYDFLDLKTV